MQNGPSAGTTCQGMTETDAGKLLHSRYSLIMNPYVPIRVLTDAGR